MLNRLLGVMPSVIATMSGFSLYLVRMSLALFPLQEQQTFPDRDSAMLVLHFNHIA